MKLTQFVLKDSARIHCGRSGRASASGCEGLPGPLPHRIRVRSLQPKVAISYEGHSIESFTKPLRQTGVIPSVLVAHPPRGGCASDRLDLGLKTNLLAALAAKTRSKSSDSAKERFRLKISFWGIMFLMRAAAASTRGCCSPVPGSGESQATSSWSRLSRARGFQFFWMLAPSKS